MDVTHAVFFCTRGSHMPVPIVTKNKAVFFTYSITDENGVVVEQSDLPVGYVHGARSDIIEKLEIAMNGLSLGDKVDVMLTPDEGFGELDPELTFTDDMVNVPPEFHQIGAEVEMHNDQGDVKKFVVSKIENGQLTLDGNHPLAGKNITFHITITDIRDADPQEIQTGRPDDNIPQILH